MSHLSKLSPNIQKIADSLPEQYQVEFYKVVMTGEDVHLSGLDDDGIKNDETEYTINCPIYIPVNHKRKMNKAYKKRGMAGIVAYVDSCLTD